MNAPLVPIIIASHNIDPQSPLAHMHGSLTCIVGTFDLRGIDHNGLSWMRQALVTQDQVRHILAIQKDWKKVHALLIPIVTSHPEWGVRIDYQGT